MPKINVGRIVLVLMVAALATVAALSFEADPLSALVASRSATSAQRLVSADRAIYAPTATVPVGALPAGLIPIDFGAIFDNLQYQVMYSAATEMWTPHTVLLGIAYFLGEVSDLLSTQLLPTILTVIVRLISRSGIVRTVMELALVLVAATLVLSYVELRVVKLGDILKYGVLAALVLAQGPTVMSAVEAERRHVAQVIYADVYREVQNSSGVWGRALSGFPATAGWQGFRLRVSPGSRGISAQDIAASGLECDPGEQLTGALCRDYERRFFPTPTIRHLGEGARSNALTTASHGLSRLLLSFPLSSAALLESVMELLFAVAGFFLLTAIPIALVFLFFLPTESIALGLAKQYLNLVMLYVVVNVLIAVGLAALGAAAGMGEIPRTVAAASLASVFYMYGISLGMKAAKSSVTALSSGIAQTFGVKDPVQQTLGVTKGTLGAGLAVAAGAPLLAPSAFTAATQPGLETLKGGGRVGLGFAGGELMENTPLQGMAQVALATGLGQGAGTNMLHTIEAEDAVIAGISSANRPLSLVYGLDMAHRRRQRLNQRYGQRRLDGTFVPSAEVAPAQVEYEPHEASPWRRPIDQALAVYGMEWANHIATAVVGAIENYEARGLTDEQIRDRFRRGNAFDLRSPGGREMAGLLPKGHRQTITSEAAQAAIRGILSEALTPAIQVTRDDLIEAIARAVETRAARGSHATVEDVAAELGTTPSAFGANYGIVASVCRSASVAGVAGDDLRRAFSEAEGTKLGALLPDTMTIVQTGRPDRRKERGDVRGRQSGNQRRRAASHNTEVENEE